MLNVKVSHGKLYDLDTGKLVTSQFLTDKFGYLNGFMGLIAEPKTTKAEFHAYDLHDSKFDFDARYACLVRETRVIIERYAIAANLSSLHRGKLR